MKVLKLEELAKEMQVDLKVLQKTIND